MRFRNAMKAALVIAVLGGCVIAADAPKSGPQIGDGVTPFDPLSVTGKYAGQERCLV